ncbi:MAG: hypothetical protein KGR24_08755, partial [Planctomycetes bacterium]|nr:hypothetical protein [Planctomycetota bacterium]
ARGFLSERRHGSRFRIQEAPSASEGIGVDAGQRPFSAAAVDPLAAARGFLSERRHGSRFRIQQAPSASEGMGVDAG